MHRVDTSTAVAVLPAAEAAGTPGFYTKGDPVGGLPATVPGPDIFNMIQEELCGVVEGYGGTLDQTKANLNQLFETMFANLAMITGNASQAFNVLTATQDNEAVNLGQMTAFLSGIEAVTQNAISGFVLSNNATDSAKDIDIGPGQARDTSGSYLMSSPGMTKQIDVPWAAGTDAGGFVDGVVVANTRYPIYEIRKDLDGAIDFIIGSIANIPAGYTAYRRVNYVDTDASANIPFFDEVEMAGGCVFRSWADYVIDASGAFLTWAPITLSAPPMSLAEVALSLTNATTAYAAGVSTTTPDFAVDSTHFDLAASTSVTWSAVNKLVQVDELSQIKVRTTAGTLAARVNGYYDRRIA